jgi:hypothetical protein
MTITFADIQPFGRNEDFVIIERKLPHWLQSGTADSGRELSKVYDLVGWLVARLVAGVVAISSC